MKSESLNLLEPSGPHGACYGTALPFFLSDTILYFKLYIKQCYLYGGVAEHLLCAMLRINGCLACLVLSVIWFCLYILIEHDTACKCIKMLTATCRLIIGHLLIQHWSFK